jgi:hypothetical protein
MIPNCPRNDRMEWLMLPVGACVGAVAFRVRGGLLTDRWRVGGQFQRLCYAVLMAALTLGAMAASD